MKTMNQFKKQLFILLALMGMSTNVWGETCYLYQELSEHSVNTKSKNTAIFTTPDLGNLDGIDTVRFEYKMSSSLAKKMHVRYSTDGNNFVNLDGSDKGCKDSWRGLTENGDDIYVIIPESLRTSIKKIQFAVFEGSTFSYTYYVKRIQISRCPTIKVDDLLSTSYEFTETAVNDNASYDFTISTYNIGDDLSISGTDGTPFSYTLSGASGSCPTEYNLHITYSPTTVATADSKHTATITVSAGGKSATLTVYGTASNLVNPTYRWKGETGVTADSYYVEDDDLDLDSIWTSNSAAEKTYSIKSWIAQEGIPTAGATAPAIAADGKTLSLGQAGTLVLGLSQPQIEEAGSGYKAGSEEITLEISRRDPEITFAAAPYYYNSTINNFFSSKQNETEITATSTDPEVASISGKTLTIYNKEDSTRVTVTQAENYKWAADTAHVDITKDVNLVQPANHVPFTITSGENAYIKSKSKNTSWDSNGYKLGDGGWDNATEEFIIGFSGIPEYVSFDKHLDNSLGQLPVNSQAIVYESDNSESGWTQVWDDIELQKEKRTADVSSGLVHLKPTTRYLKFYYKGSVYCHYNNIRITERKEFKASEETVDFGLNILGETPEDKTIKFHYANAGYKAKMSIDDAHFTIVKDDVLDTIGGEKADSAEIVIRYRSDAVYTATDAKLTISDELGNESVVTLKARTRLPQTITWSDGAAAWTYGDAARANQASALDKVAVAYATSAESVIAVDGTQLAAVGAGTATITASAAETETYAPAEAQLLMTVDKAELTVTAENKETVYGEAAPEYSIASYSGFVNGDNTSVLGGELVYSCSYTAGNGVGSYSITPSGLEAANYSFNYVAGILTVNKAELIITAKDTTITDGDDVPEFEVEYEGLYSPQDISEFEGVLVVTTDYKKGDPTGNYSITPSGFTSANYTIYYHNGTLTVNAQEEQGGGATAVDNAEAETKAVKVIRNGQIYIIRGDKTYTAEGQLVK